MKNFRQLIKELPSSTVVVSTGSFNPPTAKHELQFKLIEKLVAKHNAEHVIYISESKEGLPVSRKTHFLQLMFNNFNYVPLTGSLNEEVAKLKSKYKNVIVLGDTVKGKLAESVDVVPLEDVESNKIRSMVSKGDYSSFKNLMPSSFRDIDAKRLFNEMRQSIGLEFIKEEVKFSVDALREKYFKGEIYHVGDIVESAGSQYEIMDRGSNYLVVVDNTGNLHRKWVKDVQLVESVKPATGGLKKACWKGYTAVGLKTKNGRKVPNCVKEEADNQITYKGYTTKNFHHCAELAKSFKMQDVEPLDPVAMLNAIKTTDAYLELNNYKDKEPELYQIKSWKASHIKAQEALQKIGKFDAHQQDWIHGKEELDKMLVPHYTAIKEAIEIGKHNNYNIARSVMSYQDFMKLLSMNKGEIPDDKLIKNALDTSISTQTAEQEKHHERDPQTAVGHTLETEDHLRRRKVRYAMESVITKNENLGVKLKPEHEGGYYVRCKINHDILSGPHPTHHAAGYHLSKMGGEGYISKDAEYSQESVMPAQLPPSDGEVEGQTIKKVKTLPPNLVPPKSDGNRIGGGTRDHTFSAFWEKNQKLVKKENANMSLDDYMKAKQTGQG